MQSVGYEVRIMLLLLGIEALHACESKNSEYSMYVCKEVKTVTSKTDMLRCCKIDGVGLSWLFF